MIETRMPKVRLSNRNALGVLRLIYKNGKISRSEIIDQTKSSIFLTTRTCDKLLETGLISEAGFGTSTGGRRPTLLSINQGFGHLVGVHMGAVNIRIALTDISGTLIEHMESQSRAIEGPAVAIPHLIQLINAVLQKAGVSSSRLRGIGVGISGVLDRATGTTLFWPKLPLWVNVPVKEMLQEHFQTPIEIEDTPRTMALAEQRFGIAGAVQDFVYLLVGAGTGAALFFDGRLYTGAGGFAGEFGHITVSESGPLCSCGNRGCLETVISASALVRRSQEALALGLSNQLTQLSGGNPSAISIEMIAKAARAGDPFANRLAMETGTQLGVGIIGLINLLNPYLIVIGGGLALGMGDLLLPEIERVVKDRGMMQAVRKLQIRISTLQDIDWARGAALLVAENALEAVFLESVQTRKRGARDRRSTKRL